MASSDESEEFKSAQYHVVRIEPAGIDLTCRHGEKLMLAAWREQLRWPTICGGNAECGVCYVQILSSQCELENMELKESKALQLTPEHLRGVPIRLGCQLRVTCEMTVRRVGAGIPAIVT